MENTFDKMSDEEFLYNICAFMGVDNYIRFINIIGQNCPYGGCITGKDECGECFYEFLKKYEKTNK